MAERRSLNLSGVKSSKKSNPKPPEKTKQKRSHVDDDDESIFNVGSDDDDDELEYYSSKRNNKSSSKQRRAASDEDDDEDDEIVRNASSSNLLSNKIIKYMIPASVGIIALVIALFIFGGSDKNDMNISEQSPSLEQTETQQQTTSIQSNSNSTQTSEKTEEEIQNEIMDKLDVGTQDFTQNTNMTTDSKIGDAEEFVEDIYGLTVRVDYTVDKILSVSDFVEYEKKRGTSGGGLEIYWLDATYKGSSYKIQVPFKYYKELDTTGIVPVKMEVLYIDGEHDDSRVIISYMCLDEKTLEDVMDSQSRE